MSALLTRGSLAGDKPHYVLLDGLRGVAAIIVIWYHFFEGFATSPVDQMMNHGYLAVDFFFVLSGFVLGTAYDDRWRAGIMSVRRFMLRRVVRLHGLVVLGALLGVAAFLIQGSVRWDGTPVPLHWVAVAFLLGLLLLPVIPGMNADVRGNGEMFPLNGPSWSLFFEYIGSILYAVVLHQLSRRALKWVVAVSALMLAGYVISGQSGYYHQGVGWTVGDWGFLGGFLRLSFSFSVGLLLSRSFRPRRIRGAFWISSALLILIMACPYLSESSAPSVCNALYDVLCTLLLFPLIVYIGACGVAPDKFSGKVCGFLGGVSYPVYVIHYPAMYLFYAWVWGNGYTFAEVWPICIGIFAGLLLFAWAVFNFYDKPIRRYLSKKIA